MSKIEQIMSRREVGKTQDIIEANFLQIIKRANQEPVKKYASPQTESQEYGWINKPLIEHDITDRRLNFHHQNTSITKYMDIAWRMKEQKETVK